MKMDAELELSRSVTATDGQARRWFSELRAIRRNLRCHSMAARLALLKNTGGKMANMLGIKSFPSFSFGGSMELMAVPKKKVSRHKRGIRNGPKALKPIPVIVRCRGCGRVKLPHFFCCSGNRTIDDQNGSTN
ncbi:hypothetical protein K1719_046484 [Acacia pycnantha]|nr:hypothetical protein K1719_046484 [Acacia pycnantha]